MTRLLETREVAVTLGGQRILDGVSVHFDSCQITGLIGPNGTGKSTLIKVLAGLLPPSQGKVLFQGEPLATWNRNHLARQLAYFPQNPIAHWPLTVERLVGLGRLPHRGPLAGFSQTDREAVWESLADADVSHLAGRVVTSLSGGELARVTLARALAGRPQVLLADEPVSGLDPSHQLHVMELLSRMAERGNTVVVVLHDLGLAARFCHRLLLLGEGAVRAVGSPDQVLTADNLEHVFKVAVFSGRHQGTPFVIPWHRCR